MPENPKSIVEKENVVQAIVVADTFDDEFSPLSDSIPLCLLPLANKPLIDYTLEFLSLGGIDEMFLFCCSHIDAIKKHINKCVQDSIGWTLTMKVHIIASESCRSFGDCLRDLDAKGLLRGDFVLLEPGTISNIDLLPLLKKHNSITKNDKGVAMTLVFQEAGIGYNGRCSHEEVVIAANNSNRVLFHKKIGKSRERKINFPLEIFIDHHEVSLMHNLKDTHIAICSSSVLPLFSDNFDFQSKDDFVRGLLMNEEILGSTIYCHILKSSQYGSGITNWRMYQTVSRELVNKWIYPLKPCPKRNKTLKNEVLIGGKFSTTGCNLERTILGENIKIGKNVRIQDSFVFSNTIIEDGVVISHSVVGPSCTLKSGCKITAGSILGEKVCIEKGLLVENTLVQSEKPDFCDEHDVLGAHAFRLKLDDSEADEIDSKLARKLSRLHIKEEVVEDDFDYDFSESDDDELGYNSNSPIPDDTKLFFTEVIDSLTRGFEDQLLCDNLVLEINSSRYAYNVTVTEVNFHVMKAIYSMSFRQPANQQYFSYISRLLAYFTPIFKNYIRNEAAMMDSLEAVTEVSEQAINHTPKWIPFVLKHFYDKDYITEEVILKWASSLEKQGELYKSVAPFVAWLQEAEEESDDESD